MAYIIGLYEKYDSWDRNHAVYKFEINGIQYAIYEVELVWGLPKLKYQIGLEDAPEAYFIYETKEDAMRFVMEMKSLNH